MSQIRKLARKKFHETGLEWKHFEAWYLINYRKVAPGSLEAEQIKRAKTRRVRARSR